MENEEIIKHPWVKRILETETHHKHEIYTDESGKLRWRENTDVVKRLKKLSLNDLIPLFIALGYDKNSEPYRQLYRDMGYSLFGYWEVFYWSVNKPETEEYKINPLALGKK
jgi:hypothetical protein